MCELHAASDMCLVARIQTECWDTYQDTQKVQIKYYVFNNLFICYLTFL
jgi:hypothetical protein